MTKQQTFRELSDELESILAELQAEDIDVDDALKLHEQGTKLVNQLEKHLETAELKITQLKSKKD